MHAYTTDSTERTNIPIYLAVVSIALAWLLAKIVLLCKAEIAWWVDAPAVVGFYGILHAVFDRWAWKWKIVRLLGVVSVPDLSGRWIGTGVSSFNPGEKFSVDLAIHQQWSRISVSLSTKNSVSLSITAMMTVEHLPLPTLTYEYLNEPRAAAPQDLEIHRGTAILTYQVDVDTLEGDYYSGRGRQNYGTLRLRRAP